MISFQIIVFVLQWANILTLQTSKISRVPFLSTFLSFQCVVGSREQSENNLPILFNVIFRFKKMSHG